MKFLLQQEVGAKKMGSNPINLVFICNEDQFLSFFIIPTPFYDRQFKVQNENSEIDIDKRPI